MIRSVRLGLSLCLLAGFAQAEESSFLQGFSLRLHGGINNMTSFDDLNRAIHDLNHYFGRYGTWVEDAQGGSDFNWAPNLQVPDLVNRSDLGITLEKDLLTWPHSRLVVGLEYMEGSSGASNIWEFDVSVGNIEGVLWDSENLSVSTSLLTARYSLKDLHLPLHGHIGLGLGMGRLDATGRFSYGQTVFVDTDPEYGELAPFMDIDASHDGTAPAGRLFVGLEHERGPMVLTLDLGYNWLDFGELDGSTTLRVRNPEGEMEEREVINVPDTRHDLAPVVSATFIHLRTEAIYEIWGIPFDDRIDGALNSIGVDPSAINYDLSGGFVRLSLGYRF